MNSRAFFVHRQEQCQAYFVGLSSGFPLDHRKGEDYYSPNIPRKFDRLILRLTGTVDGEKQIEEPMAQQKKKTNN